MDKFRVYNKKNGELDYERYLLNQDGNLYQIDLKSFYETCQGVVKDGKVDGIGWSKTIIECEKEDFIIMHCIDRKDISGRDIFEGDILSYPTGYTFLVAFGEHDAFCPGDKMDETNQGFAAVKFDGDSPNYDEVYPLSDMESLTRVIGYYINGKTKYYPEQMYEMWHCPYCGRIIASDELALNPEFKREELITCECCGSEFDLDEWEHHIDELNRERDAI